MGHYRKLKAWEHARDLAIESSRAARRFPDYEQDVLADQLRRAGYSIPLNVAEGATRRGSKEFRRYLDVARASLAEVETIVDLAHDLGYMDNPTHAKLTGLAAETGKTVYGLLRKITDSASRT